MRSSTSAGRIVVVTPNEPYPFGQANGRWCHALLKGLADAGWSVRCLSVTQNELWAKGARELFDGSRVDLSFYPLGAANGMSPLWRKWRSFKQPYSYPLSDALRSEVAKQLASGCDVLHLEQLWSGYLAAQAPRSLTSIHHLESIDLRGVWHPSLSFLQSRVMKHWAERQLIGQLDDIRATTRRLADVVGGINRRATIHVIPIALDPDLFEFEADDRTTEPTVGFVGSMNWNPSYQAAERLITRVFPLVRARKPSARLLLVGWGASLLSKYQADGIDIVENVPDAKAYFFKLQVLAYPLTNGSGMMAKLLEAMAYGIPIVTTTEGMEGFSVESGQHALIADDDAALAEHILRLLDDAALRRSIRRAARGLIVERHSPAATVASLEKVYATL